MGNVLNCDMACHMVRWGIVMYYEPSLKPSFYQVELCCFGNEDCRYIKQIIADGQEDALDIYSRPGLTGLYSGKGPILDEWEISTDDVIVDELLGEGAFGEVYKGVIRGPLENPKISAVLRQAIGVPVAIKLLKSKLYCVHTFVYIGHLKLCYVHRKEYMTILDNVCEHKQHCSQDNRCFITSQEIHIKPTFFQSKLKMSICVCCTTATSAGKEKADFLAEIDMMKKIAEGYNTHIVNMVGCVTLQEPLCLITEFIPYGDLLSYLKHQRKKVKQYQCISVSKSCFILCPL